MGRLLSFISMLARYKSQAGADDPLRDLEPALQEVSDRLDALEAIVGHLAVKNGITADEMISKVKANFNESAPGQHRFNSLSRALKEIIDKG